ncbi:MAG: tetratricopeptide repeat protein [Cyanobacteria bacterium P01_G01_bin.54]
MPLLPLSFPPAALFTELLAEDSLPTFYVGILLVLLAGVALFIFRQIFKTRRQEIRFGKLQKQLQQNPGTPQDYYELGSLYLEKKLFFQAVQILQKALKLAEKEDVEAENIALIYNALGFAYFRQEQYDLAIRHYKDAIKRYPAYAIALNNLGNVYEKKQLIAPAIDAYTATLEYEPKNKIAGRRVAALKKRLTPPTAS